MPNKIQTIKNVSAKKLQDCIQSLNKLYHCFHLHSQFLNTFSPFELQCFLTVEYLTLICSPCNCKCIAGRSVTVLQDTLLSHIFCSFSYLLHQCGSKQLSLNQFTSHPPKSDFHKSFWKLSPGFTDRFYSPDQAPVPRPSLPIIARPERQGRSCGARGIFPNLLSKFLRSQNLHAAAAGIPPRLSPRSAPLPPRPRSAAAAASPRSLPPPRWQPPSRRPGLQSGREGGYKNRVDFSACWGGCGLCRLPRSSAGGGNAVPLHSRTRTHRTQRGHPRSHRPHCWQATYY